MAGRIQSCQGVQNISVFGGGVDLFTQPNEQHVQLRAHQLLLLPSFPVSASPFFSVMHSRSFLLIFSFHCKLPLCEGVGGMFASHMAVPGASGADVLGIGALLNQAHASLHTHTEAYAVPVTEEEVTD